MTIRELSEKTAAEILICADDKAIIDSFYVGDFLSRVMGKAPSGCAWFTIMANVNAAGVAVLAEIKAIVLCEGVMPDKQLKDKCSAEGIAILCTQKSVFDCCRAV